MAELTPAQAAAIASGVYKLQHTSLQELRDMREPLGCEGLFQVGSASRIQGVSGALLWKQLSGFGYVAAGEPGTPFANDLLISTRGTMGSKVGPDWLSNYNIGLEFGPSGTLVHAGFHTIWKSFSEELRQFLRGRNPARIHCVGHSLGGALANLNADMLTCARVANVAMYTFGAPRVGDGIFAGALTRRMGDNPKHRVVHPSDPVPMIPLFPFWHAPFGKQPLLVRNQFGGLINSDAHSMEDSYRSSVGQATWGQLAAAAADRADEERQIKNWLENWAEGRGTFLKGSASLLTMIGRALGWVLKTVLKVAAGVASAGVMTVLDLLAWALIRGLSLSREIASHVKTVISAIWRFLGRTVPPAMDISLAFVRWALGLLFDSVRIVAQRALSRIG